LVSVIAYVLNRPGRSEDESSQECVGDPIHGRVV
jgi:hypothetical protein